MFATCWYFICAVLTLSLNRMKKNWQHLEWNISCTAATWNFFDEINCAMHASVKNNATRRIFSWTLSCFCFQFCLVHVECGHRVIEGNKNWRCSHSVQIVHIIWRYFYVYAIRCLRYRRRCTNACCTHVIPKYSLLCSLRIEDYLLKLSSLQYFDLHIE